MMSRSLRSWVLSLLAALATAATASAQTSVTHSGSTDPATEGWTPLDVVAGVNFNYTQRPGIGPINDNGRAAWKVEDLASDPSTNSIYDRRFGSANGTLSNAYWRFSALVDALPAGPDPTTDNSASNCGFSIFTRYGNTGNIGLGFGYGVVMYDNPQGSTTLLMSGSSGNGPSSININIPNAYNWVELIHNPVDGQIALYINGQLIQSAAPYSAGAGGNFGGNIVEWADLIQTNGGYGGGKWAQVDFTYSPTALSPLGVPEPTTVTLALLGGLALGGSILRRRQRFA